MQTEDRAGETVLWSMQQVGKNEGAALLHSLGNALSHLFNQLWPPQLQSSQPFLLRMLVKQGNLGGEDTVRDAQLVENMRKEMNVWRGEGRTAVEGGDEARGTVELF
ncbi:uncharacterized protein MONOS_17851 [Monocercomonoides exilis]|uniref:uncharacterized protein n=1 Tax=Monocercomonoides exilis TaxID=2049356 RepID=UPI00355AADC3|nr:hypothetical protein MONOS_17851 [Monocercomonoides exilis]